MAIQYTPGSLARAIRARERNQREIITQLSIFADDMILHKGDQEDFIKRLLEVLRQFSKVAGYKISTQRSTAIVYTNNSMLEKEFVKLVPFTIAAKKKSNAWE